MEMIHLADNRRLTIIQELEKNRQVKVADLSRTFGVSEVSIRRDLEYLEKQGLVRRVHGGAVRIRESKIDNEVALRMGVRQDKKERIGRYAAKMIHKNDRLIIGSGTTPFQVTHHIEPELLASGNLTVITNAWAVVHQLGNQAGIQVILLGGIYLSAYDVLVGPQAVENLKSLHAEKLFIGTDGLTIDKGITTANVLEAEVERAMAYSATEVIVVTDSSKIGGKGLATILPISGIHKLITDTDAPADFIEQLRSQEIEVILV